MADLPSGTVTVLFTDIERSTALWERDRAAMREAVARQLAILQIPSVPSQSRPPSEVSRPLSKLASKGSGAGTSWSGLDSTHRQTRAGPP